MSLRIRLALTLTLLLLALFCTVFAARSTVETWQNFRQQNALMKAGDVRTVRPWMTIPYIAHTYQVPEHYLYGQLKLPDSPSLHRTPLHSLATRYNRPVDHLVNEVQGAITSYRKHHLIRPTATPPGPRKTPTGRKKQ